MAKRPRTEMSQLMRLRYLSHRRPAKAQAKWKQCMPISFTCRAGTGRDLYPSSYYPRVPITIALWACSQLENIHLN